MSIGSIVVEILGEGWGKVSRRCVMTLAEDWRDSVIGTSVWSFLVWAKYRGGSGIFFGIGGWGIRRGGGGEGDFLCMALY